MVRQAALTWWRVRNFVRTGNLSAARRRDSRATDSGTPSSSNKMLPGRTVATQYSGGPFPLPMRVSGGRAVTDLSGKMRIHSLPFRFMLRVSATRAASNCVLVIQARSSVCNPNSPKSILRLREAVPLRLPRWDFRYFTRFGIKAIAFLLYTTGPAVAASLCEAHASHRNAATELDGMIGINFLFRLQPARGAAVVVVALPAEALVLPFYTSNISPRSCHRPCSLLQSRNRPPCARCAAEFFPPDTIPSAKFLRH